MPRVSEMDFVSRLVSTRIRVHCREKNGQNSFKKSRPLVSEKAARLSPEIRILRIECIALTVD